MDGLAVAAGTADILGQQEVCRQLWTALERGRLHHCYLFEGPPGVGKATVALRLAMAANCEATAGPRPCNACRSCRLVAAGRHPDVLFLRPDPGRASGRITVEQVREVVRLLSLHRHSARRRFVIVDPADALGREAVNALLKSLEEPPEGTGFVLLSSRPRSLLPTVLSRSLRVRFRAVPVEELATWLAARGLEQPGRLARLSLGSPGRALELADGGLEQLEEALDELLGAISRGPHELFQFTQRIASGARTGWSGRVELLLHALELLLADTARQAAGREDLLLPGRAELTARWAAALWPGGLERVADALDAARRRLELYVNARLVLDALLSRLAAELGREARAAG